MLYLLFMACTNEPEISDVVGNSPDTPPLSDEILDTLDMTRIQADVDLLASDDFGGRVPGSVGHAAARDYLVGQLAAVGLEPSADGEYQVLHDLVLKRERHALNAGGEVVSVPAEVTGYSLVGVLPGNDPAFADEYIVLMAPYDHLGVTANGKVFNGAFDNITAVASLLELARTFTTNEISFPRSILFVLSDAEEDGLTGSEAWVEDPSIDLDDIVAVLSVDPIGRPLMPDYWPLVVLGSERSPALRATWDAVAPFSEIDIVHVNRAFAVGFGSDQDAFWDSASGVPSAWVTSSGMSFYHTLNDDPETIDYRTVSDHLRAMALVTAELASGTSRFSDQGPQKLSTGDLEQAQALVRRILMSDELTEDERGKLDGFAETFARGAISDDPGDSEYALAYANALFFIIRELTPAHPGPIPPPFVE